MVEYSNMYKEKVTQRIFSGHLLRNLISVTMGQGNE